MKKKRLTFYLYLNRDGGLKVRKTKYRLDDGELCVGLTLNVPHKFFKPLQIFKETSVNIPELPDLHPDISAN